MRKPTPTEAFVHQVCRQSFLSLWSYASPEGKTHGREMCDILVVCDPDIIIFSVKEVRPTKHADDVVRMTRWVRAAVDESVDQVYGAERFIQSGKHTRVRREDGSDGLPYPSKNVRRIHRVAVALGGEEHFPLPFGNFGKGFVHVFDERSFRILTSELDTITDFAEYLTTKEELFSGNTTVMFGHEEDILAVYLHGNRSFPSADHVLIEDGAWQQFIAKPEVQAKKIADQDSYLWDRLIERIGRDVAARNMIYENTIEEDESVLRVMTRENRFNRRIVAGQLRSFFEASAANKVRSRMIESLSGVGYVFLAAKRDEDRKMRSMELGLRCYVARLRMDPCATIIGIGTEQKTGELGASWDVELLHTAEIDDAFRARAEEISKDLDYFQNPVQTHLHEDEYPGICPEDHDTTPR
ncbi:MAG TPA: NERD domain-containing protein [Thermoanaerobaculia bacterium]|nr:NERD domain-containing protein [Thermoanaerobaculia bacterium]